MSDLIERLRRAPTEHDEVDTWCLVSVDDRDSLIRTLAEREALAERIDREIRPLISMDGAYDCCGCSTYDMILDHALAIVRGEDYQRAFLMTDDPQRRTTAGWHYREIGDLITRRQRFKRWLVVDDGWFPLSLLGIVIVIVTVALVVAL